MGTVVTYAGLVAVGIAYATLVEVYRDIAFFLCDRWIINGCGSVDVLASCCACCYTHVFLVMGGGAVISLHPLTSSVHVVLSTCMVNAC